MSQSTRLYLMTPAVVDPAAFRPLLEAALKAAATDCLHLRVGVAGDQNAQRFVQALAPVAQDKGVAVLIDPPSDLREVARWGADGVHVADPRGVTDALQALKPDRLVGVGGLRSKDAAMTSGEDGVDYVMFGEPRIDGTVPPAEQVIERCQWWAEVFTTPCVGYAAEEAMVGPLAATGIEFVALGGWVFAGAPADVATRLAAVARVLDR
jgi:thiamine-phosphate pyrophosphorylase